MEQDDGIKTETVREKIGGSSSHVCMADVEKTTVTAAEENNKTESTSPDITRHAQRTQCTHHLQVPTNGPDPPENLFCNSNVAGQGHLQETSDPARQLGRVHLLETSRGGDNLLHYDMR